MKKIKSAKSWQFLKQLTLIDIVLVLVLVIVSTSLFFFFKRKSEFITITVKVTDQDVLYATTLPKPWYATQFLPGDTERDPLGQVVSEIVSVERIPISRDATAIYLTMRAKATYDPRAHLYSIKGRNVVFGASVRFTLSQITFDGIVTDFPDLDKTGVVVKETEVIALGRAVDPQIANTIVSGLTMYDSNHQPLAKIEEVVIKPADKVTQTAQGQLLLQPDPLYKDVYLKVKMAVREVRGEKFILQDIPLKVDEQLPLNFSSINVFPTIIYFEDSGLPKPQFFQ